MSNVNKLEIQSDVNAATGLIKFNIDGVPLKAVRSFNVRCGVDGSDPFQIVATIELYVDLEIDALAKIGIVPAERKHSSREVASADAERSTPTEG